MKHNSHSNATKSMSSGASFLVQIHHAEHQSWQGSVQWLDTGEVLHFRSALELTLLMDQAVQAQSLAAHHTAGQSAGQNLGQGAGHKSGQDQRREWQAPMRAAR